MQLESFPCLVRSYQPFEKRLTAYAHGRAIGEDGVAYIVKGQKGSEAACANEWLCTSLAQILHLPVAPAKVLKMPDGQLVFGSGEYSHRLSDLEVGALLSSGIKPNDLILPDFPSLLSRLYAFDLFIGNYDRHLANYLITLEHSEDHSTKRGNLRAIDFDTADLTTRLQMSVPMHPQSNTVKVGRLIRQTVTFDNHTASDMLTRLRRGRQIMFEQAMFGLPEEWLPITHREALLERVASPSFESEILKLEQGLNDGTYL